VFDGVRKSSGRPARPACDQQDDAAQVIAEVHQPDLIFVSQLTDTSMIYAAERFLHDRKGMLYPNPSLGLSLIRPLLLFV
jgi:hypothetical protein